MHKPPHIIISEDEKINFVLLKKLLESFLKDKEMIIEHAVNGKQAIDFCNENVDLILMDVEMPIMDGFEASQILKEKYPKIPIIIQTAHCSIDHQRKAEAIGCNAFLPKPIIKKDLETLIKKLIPRFA